MSLPTSRPPDAVSCSTRSWFGYRQHQPTPRRPRIECAHAAHEVEVLRGKRTRPLLLATLDVLHGHQDLLAFDDHVLEQTSQQRERALPCRHVCVAVATIAARASVQQDHADTNECAYRVQYPTVTVGDRQRAAVCRRPQHALVPPRAAARQAQRSLAVKETREVPPIHTYVRYRNPISLATCGLSLQPGSLSMTSKQRCTLTW